MSIDKRSVKSKAGAIQAKQPPHNIEAEKAILGACLRWPQKAIPIAIEILTVEDFYHPQHAPIFQTLSGQFIDNVPVDLVGLSDRLRKEGKLQEIGGATYLADLMADCATDANVKYHCEIVKEKANLRRLGRIGLALYDGAYADNGTTAKELVALAGEHLFAVTRGDAESGHRRAGRLDFDFIFNKTKDNNGLPWGIGWLDNNTSGLQPQDLIIIAGREKLGKTAMGMYILRFNAQFGIPVLLLSLEMSAQAISQRIVSAQCRIPTNLLASGRTLPEHDFAAKRYMEGESFQTLKEHFIVDDRPQNPKTISATLRLYVHEYGVKMVMLDYMKLFAGDDVRAVNEAYQLIKALAKEYNVPFIVLSALHRPGREFEDRPPEASDLRIGGEYDCDYLLLGYNPAVRLLDKPTSTLTPKEFGLRNEWENKVRWYLKYDRRGGTPGAVDLFFDRSTGFIGELQPERSEPSF